MKVNFVQKAYVIFRFIVSIEFVKAKYMKYYNYNKLAENLFTILYSYIED
jgi:hypothetical protein